jgi:hypothetical protein
LFYNFLHVPRWDKKGVILFAVLFSVGYALIEYYVIRDTTFGFQPVLFSLIYPYHFLMALAFGLAGYLFLHLHIGAKGLVSGIILTGALFSSMLVIEDFAWFSLRAVAPLQGDTNGGKLVMAGEWSTQFLGSTNVQLTEIPNWYFLNVFFTCSIIVATRSKEMTETLTPTP